jgi:hypothetical protein
MRNTIILGTLLALFGVASVVQASDWSQSRDGDTVQVRREASHDGIRHDRYERKDGSRERHHESGERREAPDESREGHESRDMRR